MAIAYPAKSASVNVPGGLSSSSLVRALLQNNLSGVYVVSAVPNSSAGTVTINLNKAAGSASVPKTAKVGWFVVN